MNNCTRGADIIGPTYIKAVELPIGTKLRGPWVNYIKQSDGLFVSSIYLKYTGHFTNPVTLDIDDDGDIRVPAEQGIFYPDNPFINYETYENPATNGYP